VGGDRLVRDDDRNEVEKEVGSGGVGWADRGLVTAGSGRQEGIEGSGVWCGSGLLGRADIPEQKSFILLL
jgi:hypothetical protein